MLVTSWPKMKNAFFSKMADSGKSERMSCEIISFVQRATGEIFREKSHHFLQQDIDLLLASTDQIFDGKYLFHPDSS